MLQVQSPRLILPVDNSDIIFPTIRDVCGSLEAETESSYGLVIPRSSLEHLPKSIPDIIESEPSQLCKRFPQLFRAQSSFTPYETLQAGDVLFIEDPHFKVKAAVPECPIPPRRLCNIAEFIQERPRTIGRGMGRSPGDWINSSLEGNILSDERGNLYKLYVFAVIDTPRRTYTPSMVSPYADSTSPTSRRMTVTCLGMNVRNSLSRSLCPEVHVYFLGEDRLGCYYTELPQRFGEILPTIARRYDVQENQLLLGMGYTHF